MEDYKVYVHICPEGKRYYGATKRDVEKRWRDGYGYKKNKYFTEAIEKYGWNNIEHTVVAKGLTQDEAYWLEEELIRAFDTTNRDKGYNIGIGGPSANGVKRSEETKKKIGEAHKGKHHSEGAKNKISESMKKPVICITTGRVFSSVKEGAKYYGISHSNISQCCKGKLKSAGKYQGHKLIWRYLVWRHDKKFRKSSNK